MDNVDYLADTRDFLNIDKKDVKNVDSTKLFYTRTIKDAGKRAKYLNFLQKNDSSGQTRKNNTNV